MDTRGAATLAAQKGTSTEQDPILGQLITDLTPQRYSKLPSNGDVLRYYTHLNRGSMKQSLQTDVFKKVIGKATLFWDDAGIPTTQYKDKKSTKLLSDILRAFESLKKHKKSKSYNQEYKEFSDMCTQLYDIAHSNAENMIRCDRLRCESSKKEDLDFLVDQRTSRLMSLGALDRRYREKSENKQQRLLAEEKFKNRTEISSRMLRESVPSECEDPIKSDDSSGDEFVSPTKKVKCDNNPCPNILKSPSFHLAADIIKLTGTDRTLVAGVMHRICKHDMDTVACSKSTSRRASMVVRANRAKS